jgi:hypothetical protein
VVTGPSQCEPGEMVLGTLRGAGVLLGVLGTIGGAGVAAALSGFHTGRFVYYVIP